MRDRKIFLRAMIRASKIKADSSSSTVLEVLQDILTGKFTEIQKGRILVGSEGPNGQSVQFSIPDDWDSSDVMELAEEAMELVESLPVENQADPLPSIKPRGKVRRLRASFNPIS